MDCSFSRVWYVIAPSPIESGSTAQRPKHACHDRDEVDGVHVAAQQQCRQVMMHHQRWQRLRSVIVRRLIIRTWSVKAIVRFASELTVVADDPTLQPLARRRRESPPNSTRHARLRRATRMLTLVMIPRHWRVDTEGKRHESGRRTRQSTAALPPSFATNASRAAASIILPLDLLTRQAILLAGAPYTGVALSLTRSSQADH
jgi:hypothetical protein